MISRIGWIANCGLAGCLLLAGASWVNGQLDERFFARSSRHVDTDCEYGIEQAGFRNEAADESRYPAQTENGRPEARPETGQYRAQADTDVPMQGQRSSAVIGTSVRLGDGNRVGRIEDIVIGENGCVDFMIVSFDAMPRLGDRLAAIPWSAGQMDFRARTVTLSIERDRLYEAPIFFARSRMWPNFYESQWAGSVHGFFGTEANGERSIRRAYPTPGPKRTDDAQPDERGARPRQPKDDSRQLTPKPSPDRTTQPGNVQPDRDGRSTKGRESTNDNRTTRPAPQPGAAPDKKDVDKSDGSFNEKIDSKIKKPVDNLKDDSKKPVDNLKKDEKKPADDLLKDKNKDDDKKPE